jgi:peroxiredoxin
MLKTSVAIAFALSLTAVPALAAGPETGKPAPAFAAVDSNGKAHKLSDFAGKTVILEWSNHDCPYVKKHYVSGNMQATQKAAAAKGAVWLTIVSSAPGKQGAVTPAQANELTASRNAAPAAVLLDPAGTIGKAYEAKTTPHRRQGRAALSRRDRRQALLVAGKPERRQELRPCRARRHVEGQAGGRRRNRTLWL